MCLQVIFEIVIKSPKLFAILFVSFCSWALYTEGGWPFLLPIALLVAILLAQVALELTDAESDE